MTEIVVSQFPWPQVMLQTLEIKVTIPFFLCGVPEIKKHEMNPTEYRHSLPGNVQLQLELKTRRSEQ